MVKDLQMSQEQLQRKENFDRHSKGEEVAPYEYTIITKDGRRIDAINSTKVINYGREQAILGITTDITERIQAEVILKQTTEELVRSNAELEQFAYVASHDLKEPLRMVASYSQLLARRYEGKLDSDADEFIGFIVDGVSRMDLLINDLLKFSRIGTRGKLFTPTDCTTVLESTLQDLKMTIEDKKAVVTYDNELPTIPADDIQLGQLFQNLISNALKFQNKKSPRIHVGARRINGKWEFSVRDNGIGIESQYRERIFVIFQRLHNRGEYSGTGIGLAVCKKIVERHGGEIWLESAVGKGTTFYFTLPTIETYRDSALTPSEKTNHEIAY